MKLKRIFIKNLNNEKFIKLEKNSREYHHLVNVLRAKINENFEGFDGNGKVALLKLIKKERNSLFFEVLDISKIKPPIKKVNLAIALLKFDKLNILLKSLIELDVSNIFLFYSEFSQIKNISESKIEKLNNIIIDAGKQSGNNFLPFISKIYSFSDILNLEFTEKIFFHPYSEYNINNFYFNKEKNILIVIGPEGGFSEKEVNRLHNHGFCGIKFYGNILRTETATITSTAILKYIKGEI